MAGDEVDWGKAREALRVIRLEWAVPVLVALNRKPLSWKELREEVVNSSMKSGKELYDKAFNRTLSVLTNEEFIVRREESGTFPKSVTYSSTFKAEGVMTALNSYDEWSRKERGR